MIIVTFNYTTIAARSTSANPAPLNYYRLHQPILVNNSTIPTNSEEVAKKIKQLWIICSIFHNRLIINDFTGKYIQRNSTLS